MDIRVNVIERIRQIVAAQGERIVGARRKIASGVLVVAALWIFVQVMVSPNGIIVYQKKRTEYRQLQREIETIQQENSDLEQRNQHLRDKDPKAIEKEAREQLRYAKPGEMVYILPEQKQTDTATASAEHNNK